MDQIGIVGLDETGVGQTLFQVEMGGVRPFAQAIEQQQLKTFEQRQRILRNGRDVGEIGHIADTIAQDIAMAVLQWNRDDVDAEKIERLLHAVGAKHRDFPETAGLAQGVAEFGGNMLDDTAVAVKRYLLALQLAERAQVVDTVQMVGVRVSVKHGINARQPLAQGLLPQVGTGIDEDDLPARQQHGRRAARALVARIGRGAGGAVAADHRRAGAGACPEDDQLHGFAARNSVKKLRVVAAATSSTLMPRRVAISSAT